MSNPDLRYRPLYCGVSIFNLRINEPGTLGYFGRDRSGNTWLISAYHVLCNSNLAPYTFDKEIVFQPAANDPSFQVAATAAAMTSFSLDCAAALVDPHIVCINSQLGLGAVSQPKPPTLGMRLAKSGAATGITEGIITQISGDTLRIETDPAFNKDYILSDAGDSGSLWVEQDT